MKFKAILLLLSISHFMGSSSARASASAIRISVTKFTDKSARGPDANDCRYSSWYYGDLGSAFAEILTDKLRQKDGLQVFERENIREIYENEHQLVNSDKKTLPQKNKFKSAQYTISGVVTQFEWCTGGAGGDINVGQILGIGNFGLGVHTSKAEVKVNLRLINVATGEIIYSASGEGLRKSSSAKINLAFKETSLDGGGFKQSPLGEATETAIEEATNKITDQIFKSKKMAAYP